MKKYISAFCSLAILSLILVACESSNKPKKDPIPEPIADMKDAYNSYKACLSEIYSEGMTITFKREDHTEETFTIDYSQILMENDEGITDCNCELGFSSDNGCIISINLSANDWEKKNAITEAAVINITTYSPQYSEYHCPAEIIHSGDKLYLRDAQGQYVCVLQWRVGIIYMEDNAGHTWNAL